jgi:hypothetical protein
MFDLGIILPYQYTQINLGKLVIAALARPGILP